MKRSSECDLRHLAEELKLSLNNKCCCLCDETLCGGNAFLLCFEKYYVRSQGWFAFTVLLSNEKTFTVVKTIISGGGKGLFTDLGAFSSAANMIKNFFLGNGFEVVYSKTIDTDDPRLNNNKLPEESPVDRILKIFK